MDLPGATALLACVALAAAAGAWLARRHALRHGLLDQPGERRSHVVPTPRGGGIGIVVAWGLACVVVASRGGLPPALAAAAVAGCVLVGGAGWIDDHRPLSPWWRLLAHVAAGAALAAGVAASGGATWLVLVAFAAVPVLVNVWNFMDGIDGLAASQAGLAALGFALLAPPGGDVLPALALSAACLGFLPSNVPRARIFLGDVGSGVLGFALALLACVALLQGGQGGDPGLLPLVLLPLSAFLIDATLTLGGRIVRGERWWEPHVGHAYQRLAARRRSHMPVTLAYGGWTVVTILSAWASAGHGIPVRLVVSGACLVAGLLVWCFIAAPPPSSRTQGPSAR